jgi:hypothetical protein
MANDDDGSRFFRNFYECETCDHQWNMMWSGSEVDDACPKCGRTMSPYECDEFIKIEYAGLEVMGPRIGIERVVKDLKQAGHDYTQRMRSRQGEILDQATALVKAGNASKTWVEIFDEQVSIWYSIEIFEGRAQLEITPDEDDEAAE